MYFGLFILKGSCYTLCNQSQRCNTEDEIEHMFSYFESLNKVLQNLYSLTLSSGVSVFKVGHQRRKCTKFKSLRHMIQHIIKKQYQENKKF